METTAVFRPLTLGAEMLCVLDRSHANTAVLAIAQCGFVLPSVRMRHAKKKMIVAAAGGMCAVRILCLKKKNRAGLYGVRSIARMSMSTARIGVVSIARVPLILSFSAVDMPSIFSMSIARKVREYN